jgi:hypothetical protein
MVDCLAAILAAGQSSAQVNLRRAPGSCRDNRADRRRFTRGENAAMDGGRPRAAAIPEPAQP